jgi:hypothetical protein
MMKTWTRFGVIYVTAFVAIFAWWTAVGMGVAMVMQGTTELSRPPLWIPAVLGVLVTAGAWVFRR